MKGRVQLQSTAGGRAAESAWLTALPGISLGAVRRYNVDDMCKHQWAWASKYPQGYDTPL